MPRKPHDAADDRAPSRKSGPPGFTEQHPKPFEASLGRIAGQRECGHQVLAHDAVSAADAIRRMAAARIEEIRAQSRLKCVATTAEAIQVMAAPKLYRCVNRRGYTRWRYGINRIKAARLFVAASRFGEVGKAQLKGAS